MQLPCLCGVMTLLMLPCIWSWRTDFEKLLKQLAQDDAVNREALQHDLAWDEAVDGSYDINLTRWNRADTWPLSVNAALHVAHFGPIITPDRRSSDAGWISNDDARLKADSHSHKEVSYVPLYSRLNGQADTPRSPSSTAATAAAKTPEIELAKPTVEELKDVEMTAAKSDGSYIDLFKGSQDTNNREQDEDSSTESSSVILEKDMETAVGGSQEEEEEADDIQQDKSDNAGKSLRPDVAQPTAVVAPFTTSQPSVPLSSTISMMQKTPRIPLYPKVARRNIATGPDLTVHSSQLQEQEHDGLLNKLDRVEDNDRLTSDSGKGWAFFLVTVACTGLAFLCCIIAVVFYRRYSYTRKVSRFSFTSDAPVYGVIGPQRNCGSVDYQGDSLLAKSAEDYHYRSQRKSMISSNSSGNGTYAQADLHSDYDSDQDEEEDQGSDFGDYTVYECPGLAPAGQLEIINPMYLDRRESRSSQASIVVINLGLD